MPDSGLRIPGRLPLLLTHQGVLLPGSSGRFRVDSPRNMSLVRQRLLRGTSLRSTIIGLVPGSRDPELGTDPLPPLHRTATAGVAVQVVGSNWPKPHYSLLVTGLCRVRVSALVQERPFVLAEVEQLDKLDQDAGPAEPAPGPEIVDLSDKFYQAALQIEALKLLQKSRSLGPAQGPPGGRGGAPRGQQFSLEGGEEEEDADDMAVLERKVHGAGMSEAALKVCLKELRRWVAAQNRPRTAPEPPQNLPDPLLPRLKKMPTSMPEYALTRNYLDLMVDLPWNRSTTGGRSFLRFWKAGWWARNAWTWFFFAGPSKVRSLPAPGTPQGSMDTFGLDSRRFLQTFWSRGRSPPGPLEGPAHRDRPRTARPEEDLPRPDRLDIAAARRQLDQDHYGLERLKRRVLEYLAVRRLKASLKGPILCFVGPPGVGKTSVGRSVARTLGREFHRIALGGVCDQADIRGHRRTYVGSLPGRIISGLKSAGVHNPVLLLDEVDKLGKSLQGDPAAALLEVLDPEQNHSFTDHYLNVAFDLSQVLFIATANTVASIPPALLDRMEVLQVHPRGGRALSGEEDRSHLPSCGCKGRRRSRSSAPPSTTTKEESDPEPPAEQGERGAPPEMPIVIDRAALGDILGPPLFDMEVSERLTLPGVAVGLAWTPHGGEIMFVEASRMEGDVTGGPDPLEGTDIHLHFPAGAVTKDGPSAGVTIVTCLASLLSGRLVRSDVAMTGEITLRGLVLPVSPRRRSRQAPPPGNSHAIGPSVSGGRDQRQGAGRPPGRPQVPGPPPAQPEGPGGASGQRPGRPGPGPGPGPGSGPQHGLPGRLPRRRRRLATPPAHQQAVAARPGRHHGDGFAPAAGVCRPLAATVGAAARSHDQRLK
ncbi:unnamed protein product [Tetraodon nigroviridis]|uniref:Lon protease homolog n=1 Tax=Tetraodon nigroviridis TaxID=99883 RepID=Q4T681_TETNG|nr:unnamed protein product [Tetraodon nigroviridis]